MIARLKKLHDRAVEQFVGELWEDYQEGQTLKGLAAQHKCSYASIRKLLMRHEGYRNRVGKTKREEALREAEQKKKAEVKLKRDREIVDMRGSGMSWHAISSALMLKYGYASGVSVSNVQHRYNIMAERGKV